MATSDLLRNYNFQNIALAISPDNLGQATLEMLGSWNKPNETSYIYLSEDYHSVADRVFTILRTSEATTFVGSATPTAARNLLQAADAYQLARPGFQFVLTGPAAQLIQNIAGDEKVPVVRTGVIFIVEEGTEQAASQEEFIAYICQRSLKHALGLADTNDQAFSNSAQAIFNSL